MSDSRSTELVELLEACRARERAQTRFYRSLAAEAELIHDADAAERLNALHADEQHHLSRLTALLLEMGVPPRELAASAGDRHSLEGWEGEARSRESAEVTWYQGVLRRNLPAGARALFEEILASEERHRDELGGKWMPA